MAVDGHAHEGIWYHSPRLHHDVKASDHSIFLFGAYIRWRRKILKWNSYIGCWEVKKYVFLKLVLLECVLSNSPQYGT